MKSPAEALPRALSAALGTALVLSLPFVFRLAGGLRMPGNDQGYAPQQPIAYSHRLHAGELAIPCLYCHSGAERSRTAGIPPLGTCMNCHAKVTAPFLAVRAEAAAAEKEKRKPRLILSPEIGKLYDALALDPEGKPLPAPAAGDAAGAAREENGQRAVRWNRVHNLADFVYFDHRPHVGAGVACQTCHGPVETMEKMRQHSDLSMGWCVNCHRRSKVEAPLLNWPKKAEASASAHASTDCKTCHF